MSDEGYRGPTDSIQRRRSREPPEGRPDDRGRQTGPAHRAGHRSFRLVLLVIGLLVACAAMMAATDTASARTTAAPDSGHHVVHDLHCESFTGPTAAPTSPPQDEIPAVDVEPVAGSAASVEACDAPATGSHPPRAEPCCSRSVSTATSGYDGHDPLPASSLSIFPSRRPRSRDRHIVLPRRNRADP